MEIKIEGDQECSLDLPDTTSVEENYKYENEANSEEEEIKIEIRDDFQEMYYPLMCKSNEIKVELSEKSIEEIVEPTTINEEPMSDVLEALTCEASQEKIPKELKEKPVPKRSKPHKCET